MTSLEKRLELDSIDIVEPVGITDLLEAIFRQRPHDFPTMVKPISAPFFAYKESLKRNQLGLIDRDSRIEYYLADANGRGSIHFGVERDILQLSGSRVGDSDRGSILVAFCKIEFILDALLLHAEGVYEEKISYQEFYKNMIKNGDAPFHTFENKKKYLRMKGLIGNSTVTQLTKAQQIRNHIAHQYLLDQQLFRDEEASDAEFVQRTFNKAWLFLVRDYNPLQLKILQSIVRRRKSEDGCKNFIPSEAK